MLLSTVLFFSPTSAQGFKTFYLAFTTLLCIIGGIGLLRRLKHLDRLARLRENVLRGGSASLAREQPVPNANALPIPATIELNNSRGTALFISIVIALLFVLFAIGVLAGLSSSRNHSSTNTSSPNLGSTFTLLLILSAMIVLILLVALVLIFWQMRQQRLRRIVIDEQGLSSTYHGITSSIRWTDARLFAIISPDKPTAIKFYELSNATTVVHWANLPARTLFGQGMNEHNARYRSNIQALLSVIVARTGLPLYDFSATLKGQKQQEIAHQEARG